MDLEEYDCGDVEARIQSGAMSGLTDSNELQDMAATSKTRWDNIATARG